MTTVSFLRDLRRRHGIEDAAIAVGVFDGVHRGHRQIIAALAELAAATRAAPVVVTFEPHPRAVLQPDRAPQLLTVKDQKLRLLDELGVVATVLLPFSRSMAAMEPERFLDEYLLSGEVRVRGVCVGQGWRFGAQGRGDTALLRRYGREHGFEVVSVPEYRLYGRPVSSTRIRSAVAAGRLRFAARLLGRPYSVYGRVTHGKGMGGPGLRCPTANLADPQVLLPPCGVYAARGVLFRPDTRRRNGIAYVGTAPTLRSDQDPAQALPILELHLFEFRGDIYHEPIEVEFLDFVRPDRRFPSAAALATQIRSDIRTVRRLFAAGPRLPPR